MINEWACMGSGGNGFLDHLKSKSRKKKMMNKLKFNKKIMNKLKFNKHIKAISR